MTKEKHRDDANLFTEILFILFLVLVFWGEIRQGKRCIMETKQKSWAKSNSVN